MCKTENEQLLSLIVPFHVKDKRHITLNIDVLNRFKSLDCLSEIIVVFNAFTYKEFREIKDNYKSLNQNFIALHNPETMLIGHARNLAASKAKGKYLIFFDSDVEIEEEVVKYIPKAINNLEDNNAQALYPHLNEYKSNSKLVEIDSLEDRRAYKSRVYGDKTICLGGAFILINRELFIKLGFEERVVCAEDRDIAARLLYSSGKIIYDPNVKITHRNSGDLKDIFKRKKFHAKANALIYERYPQYYHKNIKDWISIISSKLNPKYHIYGVIYAIVMIYYMLNFYMYRIKLRLFTPHIINFMRSKEL